MNLSEKEIDVLNQKISKKVMDSKEALLVTTILNKQVVLRMCLINPKTTIDDVNETLALCHKFGEEILKK